MKEVVDAVDGRIDVFMDGGIRQGTDVLKALALGAKAVFVGRPVLWGLSYDVSFFHFIPSFSSTGRIEPFMQSHDVRKRCEIAHKCP